MCLCFVLRETVELWSVSAKGDASKYRQAYDGIAKALNSHCWDGEWYIRGTNDRGR